MCRACYIGSFHPEHLAELGMKNEHSDAVGFMLFTAEVCQTYSCHAEKSNDEYCTGKTVSSVCISGS